LGSGGFTVSGSHTYASHGAFTLTVEADDSDGTSGKGTCAVTVSASGQLSTPNQNATINFWAGKHGQALIDSFNGGPSSTALATWLATSFPNLIYATTLSLGGTAGAADGFSVTNNGLGASFVYLGTNGAAFDAPNKVAVTAYFLMMEAN
jgi:hypothetical protein